jgi:alcohol dehydrogenase
MRALTFSGPGQVEWHEAPAPDLPGPDAALVRPIAVGVCDFDRAMISGVLNILPPPIVLGHEIVGEVAAVGASVGTVEEGDQVILPMQVSCGRCSACHDLRTNSCESVPRLSNYGLGEAGGGFGGGMSDLLSVPYADAMLLKVPEELSAVDSVAMGCNLTEAYRCLAPLQRFPDGAVLVLGGHGPSIAYATVALARAMGVEYIDFSGSDPYQLAQAEALGARPVKIGERLRKGGYAVIADFSLDPKHLAIGLAALAPDGVCSMPWVYPDPVTLPLRQMFRNNGVLEVGQAHIRGFMEPTLEILKSRTISSTTIPHEVLDWERADAEYGCGTSKRIFVR